MSGEMERAVRCAIHLDDDLTMLVGPATDGALLEIGILDIEGDDPVVIHSADNHGEDADTPTAADLAAVADRLENVLALGKPEQTKALLRILIAELRVNSKTSIQPTYRIAAPGVCATSEKVETIGREAAKSSLLGRQTLAHAGTASLRRTMPEPTGRPSLRRPST
jgi:hypothetical protein